MRAVRVVSGTGLPLKRSDVDTDQIIPAEWLKRVERTGFEQGLFSTIKASVELFRIDDFDIHRPFGMRVLGYSMLHLRSSDPDLSTVVITGIPNLEALADQLRECSLKERTRRKITTFVKA